MIKLHTPFTSQTDIPHPEYPRPQMVRESYLSLNGVWEFDFSPKRSDFPNSFGYKITVPFSPQSILSGIEKKVSPFDYLYYQKKFYFPANFNCGRVLLHFGAVDMFCVVYVNGQEVCQHTGGFHPFSLDITNSITDFSAEQTLQVLVWDITDSSYHTTGKQSLRRGGIWYTPQSGIWQSVWCESVPHNYIKSLKITPLFDKSAVKIQLFSNGILSNATATIIDNDKTITEVNFVDNVAVANLSDFIAWSPENPHLYDISICTDTDSITSYFGMRKFDIAVDSDGYARIRLNNKPYFMNGLLDQGYWSDGMLTAPSDQALRYDVEKTKELGFNMLRKHIKIEPLRWYYYCDKLGMIVWQDAPSGGENNNNLIKQILPFTKAAFKDNKYRFFGRTSKQGKEEFLSEYRQMIDYLYNVVSIAVWVPFNEGWGQFDALSVAELTKQLDNTRLCDHASGLHDQGGGDYKSVHRYNAPLYTVKDNRAYIVSECGGYALKKEGHLYNPKRLFGYRSYKDEQSLLNALEKFFLGQVVPLIDKGLCATVYTQVSDVEDEINGLLTYDRAICKVDSTKMKEINCKVKYKEQK